MSGEKQAKNASIYNYINYLKDSTFYDLIKFEPDAKIGEKRAF